jgi:hypothetical protein
VDTPDLQHVLTEAEGWYEDPYGRHSHRWYSDGHPTALVRDVGEGHMTEGRDEPTSPELPGVTPVVAPEATDGSDLHRADESVGGPSAPDLKRAAPAEGPVDGASHDPFLIWVSSWRVPPAA